MGNNPFKKPSFIVSYICGAIITVGVFFWFMKRASMPFDEKFRQEVRDINSKLPMKIDECTILDSVAYIENQPEEAVYFYHIQGVLDNPGIWNESMIQSVRQNTLETVTQNDMTSMMRKRGFLFRYHYYSDSNPQQLLFEFVLGPDDYSEKE